MRVQTNAAACVYAHILHICIYRHYTGDRFRMFLKFINITLYLPIIIGFSRVNCSTRCSVGPIVLLAAYEATIYVYGWCVLAYACMSHDVYVRQFISLSTHSFISLHVGLVTCTRTVAIYQTIWTRDFERDRF